MDQELKIPHHIAIIMDGNGRWANEKHIPKIMGHSKGAEVIRLISKACIELGVAVLTLFAFSTENWKRPKEEVDALMNLLRDYLKKEKDNLNKNGIKFRAIGRLNLLPEDVQKGIDDLVEKTKDNSNLTLILAINYGSRSEIVDASKLAAKKVLDGKMDVEDIDEKEFAKNLYTKDLPDPDLFIRTSGEMRLSNFLLWQASYSEIYITKKLWPDFTKDDLVEAIKDFSVRNRRFGG